MTAMIVGVVGLGGAGRAHVQRFRRNRHVGRIVGFDIRHEAIAQAACEPAESLAALLAQVDVVSICTPDHLHLQGIASAIGAGKHVLVEKPMVASHREALELKAILAARPDLVFAIHHQMRHAAPFEKAAELAASGALGKVYYIEANYWHDMTYRSTKFDNWRIEHGQSLLFGHACHPFDLIMHIAGGEPERHATYLSKIGYAASPEAYTAATTMMGFPGGLVGKSHVNSCAIFPQLNDVVVLGSEASYIDGIVFRDGRFEQVAGFFRPGQPDVAVNVVDIRIPPRFVSLSFNVYLRTMNWLAGRLMKKPDYGFRRQPMTVYNHDGACQTIIDNFIAAVQGREPVLVGYGDGERVIRLCEETERDGLASLAERPL